MSEGKSLAGISQTTFIVGLIVAILASSLVSTVATTQLGLIQGLEGDKGDTGPQGPQNQTRQPSKDSSFNTWLGLRKKAITKTLGILVSSNSLREAVQTF